MTERSITILGIFAAIVLTFNSGLTFSSTVLQNLINANIYRAIIITIVLGLIIANVLLGLFYYLERVVHKNDDEKTKTVIPMIFLNVILAILLALTVVFWNKGLVEKRDKEITNNNQATQTTVIEDSQESTTVFIDVTP